MRHAGQNNRRHRQRHNNQRRGGGNGAPNRMQVFDSNGPEVRIRGTAYQICEKYQALAKDAAAQGDTVMAESYLQHAEHYQRIINSWGLEHRAPQNMASTDQPSVEVAQDNASEAAEDDLSLPVSILGQRAPAQGAGNETVSQASYSSQKEENLERA